MISTHSNGFRAAAWKDRFHPASLLVFLTSHLVFFFIRLGFQFPEPVVSTNSDRLPGGPTSFLNKMQQ